MKRKKQKSRGFKVSPAHASTSRFFGETHGYLMGCIINPFKSKWGISDKPQIRRAQVDKDVAGPVYTIFSMEILWGWMCEQTVHFLYHFQNAPFEKGTGRTEWFWNFNPIFGGVMFWLTWNHGQELRELAGIDLRTQWIGNGLCFLCPFIWIDGLVWLLFFRFLGWGLAAGLLWALIYFIIHHELFI